MNEYEYLTGHGKGVKGGGFSAETAAQYRQAGRSGGGRFGEAPKGRIGKIGGILNVGFTALDYVGRKSEGQSNLQAGVGAAAGLAGGIAGFEAGAALGATIGSIIPGAGTLAGGLIGGLIGGGLALTGGYFGGKYGGELADKLTGADKIDERLKAQETKQREAASASNVTFESITDKFDKVVSKFEKIAGGMGAAISGKQPSNASTEDKMTEYGEYGERDQSTSPTPGQLQDLESTGGVLPSSSPKGDKFGYSSWRKRNHNGIDYPLPEGTPISVIQPGTVADAGFRDDGYGNRVKVNHPGGVSSFYAHLSSINVTSGQKIDPGTVIGKIGTTGHSTGPHLHFEVDVNGKVSNPEPYEDRLFRFGGNVKVKPKAGASAAKGAPDQKNNTIEKQQPIEDFIKGTKDGDKILKDPKLKAQLLGQKTYSSSSGFEGLAQTPEKIDPKVKQYKEMYNAYVRDLREKNQKKIDTVKSNVDAALRGDYSKMGAVVATPTQPVPAAVVAAPLQKQTPGTVVLMGNMQPQVAARPSIVPVPIPMGGGQSSGGEVVVVSPSEGDILNSLWKNMLLTNLSSS